jgi:hypothetical protein
MRCIGRVKIVTVLQEGLKSSDTMKRCFNKMQGFSVGSQPSLEKTTNHSAFKYISSYYYDKKLPGVS